jgi:hypothetical protein
MAEPSPFDRDIRKTVRIILARQAYEEGVIRQVRQDLTGFTWLVATHRGLFAVSLEAVMLVAHGWFFGLHLHGNHLYLFENCGERLRDAYRGRIVRFSWQDGRLSDPQILVTGLHGNGHQLRVIDGLLCLVDTANQRVLRFHMDGRPLDIKTPFPPAPDTDTSGTYVHMNGIARVRGELAVMLHNGKSLERRKSELVWLDEEWKVARRVTLHGYKCHDIVPDDQGTLWHCASESGEIMADDGRRIKLSDNLMTRAMAFCGENLLVGMSSFGPRQIRDALAGEVAILDRDKRVIARHEMPSGPADAVALT